MFHQMTGPHSPAKITHCNPWHGIFFPFPGVRVTTTLISVLVGYITLLMMPYTHFTVNWGGRIVNGRQVIGKSSLCCQNSRHWQSQSFLTGQEWQTWWHWSEARRSVPWFLQSCFWGRLLFTAAQTSSPWETEPCSHKGVLLLLGESSSLELALWTPYYARKMESPIS